MTVAGAASLSSQAAAVLGASGLTALALGIAIIVFAGRLQRDRAAFAARATAVDAVVVDNVWHTSLGSGSDSMVLTAAYPLLRYQLPDGTVVEHESIEGASPPVARKGSMITALYDASDPSRVRPAGGGLAGKVVPLMLVLFGVIFAAIGALVLLGAIALLVV